MAAPSFGSKNISQEQLDSGKNSIKFENSIGLVKPQVEYGCNGVTAKPGYYVYLRH